MVEVEGERAAVPRVHRGPAVLRAAHVDDQQTAAGLQDTARLGGGATQRVVWQVERCRRVG